MSLMLAVFYLRIGAWEKMITDKETLRKYLEAEKKALGATGGRPHLFGQEVWKYQISLRKYEYYLNKRGGGVLLHVWKFIHHYLGVRLGFTIPPNTCGKGLHLHHYGHIVINKNVRVGENCKIISGVVIGQGHALDDVPIIGNDVFIGANAVLFGKITIADGAPLAQAR